MLLIDWLAKSVKKSRQSISITNGPSGTIINLQPYLLSYFAVFEAFDEIFSLEISILTPLGAGTMFLMSLKTSERNLFLVFFSSDDDRAYSFHIL